MHFRANRRRPTEAQAEPSALHARLIAAWRLLGVKSHRKRMVNNGRPGVRPTPGDAHPRRPKKPLSTEQGFQQELQTL